MGDYTGVNRTHRLADQLRSAIGWMGRVPSDSQFVSKGTLTPNEFIEAGDRLVTQYPTWQWNSCTNSKYKVFWLPNDKQYLLTKNVPCRHRINEWDKNFLQKSHTTAEGWFVPEGEDGSKINVRKKTKMKTKTKPVETEDKTEDNDNKLTELKHNDSINNNNNKEMNSVDKHEVMISHTVLSSEESDDGEEDDDSEDEGEKRSESSTDEKNNKNETNDNDKNDIIDDKMKLEDLDDDFVDVANPRCDDPAVDDSEFTVLESGAPSGSLLNHPPQTGVFSSWRQSASSSLLSQKIPSIGFKNSVKEIPRQDRETVKDRRNDRGKGKCRVIPTRSYDISITYDKYYQSPRLWLFGYDEDGIPLASEAVFEDILPNYISKTVTVDPHPCTGVPTVSIHPCQHSSVLKNVVQNWIQQGIEPRHDLALFVLLKMIGSAVPTINYDFTMDIEMSFGNNNNNNNNNKEAEERNFI